MVRIRSADYLTALEAAIFLQHKCKPVHNGTVFVRAQTQDGQPLWEGYVETFNVIGHPEATTCYAWQYTDSTGKSKILAVLGNNLITSAQKAVQAAIFIGAQPPAGIFLKDLKLIKKQLEECRDLIRKMGIASEDLSAEVESSQESREERAWKRQQVK